MGGKRRGGRKSGPKVRGVQTKKKKKNTLVGAQGGGKGEPGVYWVDLGGKDSSPLSLGGLTDLRTCTGGVTRGGGGGVSRGNGRIPNHIGKKSHKRGGTVKQLWANWVQGERASGKIPLKNLKRNFQRIFHPTEVVVVWGMPKNDQN